MIAIFRCGNEMKRERERERKNKCWMEENLGCVEKKALINECIELKELNYCLLNLLNT